MSNNDINYNFVMKTPHPWVNFKDDKTYLGLFHSEILNQIIYARIAIEYIENAKGEYSHHLFFGIQGLLCSLANISKLLNDKHRIGKDKDRAKKRAKKILHDFQIDVSKISLILNRNLRNTNEHYDERLDEFVEKFPTHLYLDSISAPGIDAKGHPFKIGRFYNNKTKTVQFMDSTITKIDDLDIDKVKDELRYLENQLKESKK